MFHVYGMLPLGLDIFLKGGNRNAFREDLPHFSLVVICDTHVFQLTGRASPAPPQEVGPPSVLQSWWM